MRTRVDKFAALQTDDDTGAQRLLQDFNQGYRQWRATTERVIELAQQDPAAASALSQGEGIRQFEAMRDTLDQLGELEEQAAAAASDSASEQAAEHKWQQGFMVALGLLLCAGLMAGFPLLVTRPLQRLVERLREVAEGDGDLRQRLAVSSRDEIGQLGDAFNLFLDKLQPLIAEVGRVTVDVDASARQLAGIASHSARLIDSQHASVDQVSTAATEMSAAIAEVARNAQHAASAASDAATQSGAGARVVMDTLASIRQLSHEIESASDSIGTLASETANIGAVLAVIKSIAEQTNLLALNAAIEAARAGEQGRGFAVVADEVRALAARTQDSTRDIQEMIERLQHGVQRSVDAMHTGSARARDSVERAAGVDQVIEQTGHAIQQINDMVVQIATACEQQSNVTDEIARNITDIRDLSDEVARSASSSTTASQGLSTLSGELSRLVGRFQV